MARARIRHTGGILASILVQSPGMACEHGAVWWRDCQHQAIRLPHLDADGQRALCERRVPASSLRSEPAGRRLGQQPHPTVEPQAAG